MRHTIKGAAAFAALCAGALALSPMAYAAQDTVPGKISATRAEFGGGANHTTTAAAAWIGRISGHDRIQTSLESLASTKSSTGVVKNIFIVEKNSTVDALTLAPLAKMLLGKSENSAVVYANKDGLTKGAITSLKEYADKGAAYFMVGGTAKLSTAVDQQVGSSIYSELGEDSSGMPIYGKTYRLDGKDRYETAYLVSGLVIGGATVESAARNYGEAIVLKADYERALREWNEADAMGEKLQKDVEAAQAALDKGYEELIKATPTPVKNSDLDKKMGALADAVGPLKASLKAYNDCTADTKKQSCDTEKGTYGSNLTTYNDAVKALAVLVSQDVKYKAAADKVAKLQDKVDGLKKALKKAKDSDNKNLKENLDKATKALVAAVVNGASCTIPAGKSTTACVGAGKTLIAKRRADFVKSVDAAWRLYSGDVVFATGTNFADALTAGPAAAKLPAPILLTAGSSYMETVRALGKGVADKYIYAVGGPAAKAAKDLVATKKYHSMIKDLYVGKDRYETAYKLAKASYLGKESTKNYNRDMVLASGVVGADAVVAGVWSVNNIYAGILLTRPDSLPTVTADYIAFGDNASAQQGAVKNLVIFGGYAAVSHETASVAWAKMGQ